MIIPPNIEIRCEPKEKADRVDRTKIFELINQADEEHLIPRKGRILKKVNVTVAPDGVATK